MAACFIVWDLGEAAGFATVARFGKVACFGDLSGFDEKTSDSQLASLVSIGKNANAAIAAMMVRRWGQTPKPERANFLPDDGNRYPPGVIFCSRVTTESRRKTPFNRDYEPWANGILLHVGFGRMVQKTL